MGRMDGEPAISRQQKVMAAKAAFGQNSSGMGRLYHGAPERSFSGLAAPVKGTRGMPAGEEAFPEEEWQAGRRFGLLRFMTAGMLLLVLVAAFHQGFSYEGFDKAYVQEKLNDETAWNRLEEQVRTIYVSLEKQWKK